MRRLVTRMEARFDERLALFDTDQTFREKQEAKHGGREGYAAALLRVIEGKIGAARVQRAAAMALADETAAVLATEIYLSSVRNVPTEWAGTAPGAGADGGAGRNAGVFDVVAQLREPGQPRDVQRHCRRHLGVRWNWRRAEPAVEWIRGRQ